MDFYERMKFGVQKFECPPLNKRNFLTFYDLQNLDENLFPIYIEKFVDDSFVLHKKEDGFYCDDYKFNLKEIREDAFWEIYYVETNYQGSGDRTGNNIYFENNNFRPIQDINVMVAIRSLVDKLDIVTIDIVRAYLGTYESPERFDYLTNDDIEGYMNECVLMGICLKFVWYDKIGVIKNHKES